MFTLLNYELYVLRSNPLPSLSFLSFLPKYPVLPEYEELMVQPFPSLPTTHAGLATYYIPRLLKKNKGDGCS